LTTTAHDSTSGSKGLQQVRRDREIVFDKRTMAASEKLTHFIQESDPKLSHFRNDQNNNKTGCTIGGEFYNICVPMFTVDGFFEVLATSELIQDVKITLEKYNLSFETDPPETDPMFKNHARFRVPMREVNKKLPNLKSYIRGLFDDTTRKIEEGDDYTKQRASRILSDLMTNTKAIDSAAKATHGPKASTFSNENANIFVATALASADEIGKVGRKKRIIDFLSSDLEIDKTIVSYLSADLKIHRSVVQYLSEDLKLEGGLVDYLSSDLNVDKHWIVNGVKRYKAWLSSDLSASGWLAEDLNAKEWLSADLHSKEKVGSKKPKQEPHDGSSTYEFHTEFSF
jgi:hypothetical protein